MYKTIDITKHIYISLYIDTVNIAILPYLVFGHSKCVKVIIFQWLIFRITIGYNKKFIKLIT